MSSFMKCDCKTRSLCLADRIKSRCTASCTQAQRPTPLVLAKDFPGELVPQDANDEPASALLARIASSNTAVAGKNASSQ